MQRCFLPFGMAALALVLVSVPVGAQTAKQQARELRGRIVKTNADNFVIQTRDNKTITVYSNPQTKYVINNQPVKYSELRVGTEVNTAYVLEGERYIANNVVVVPAESDAPVRDAPVKEAPAGNRAQGKINNLGTDHFIIVVQENRKETFHVHPQTKFRVNNKAAKYTDLSVGATVSVAFTRDGDKNLANEVAQVADTSQAADPKDEGTLVEGKVLRVVGKDQVVVRTTDGKEVTLYVSPQTSYQINDQAARFTDLRPGVDIGVRYDVRDQRNIARRVFTPKRK